MMGPVQFKRRFDRLSRLKELVVDSAMSFGPRPADSPWRIASIIGDHISDRIRAYGLYEREFLDLLRDCVLDLDAIRQQVAIDVGANIGNHSLFLSGLFARVIAFEPNPLALSLLKTNLALNGVSNVETKSLALSDRAGRSSLRWVAGNLGAARIDHLGNSPAPAGDPVEIELARGDDVIDLPDRIGFIKIDVEGSEDRALAGLARTIRTHRPVLMIEQLAGAIDPRRGTSPAFEMLCELGYTTFELRPARLSRGRLGTIASLLLGRETHRVVRTERLEPRDYSALVFMPEGYPNEMVGHQAGPGMPGG